MSIDMVHAAEGDVPEGIDIFIPPWYDIFWSAVMFIALFGIFWKYVLPRMKTALEARSEGIEKKLEQAEVERNEARALLEQYREQLAEARSEAARIRADAQAERESIVTEARSEAQEAAAAVNERAEMQLTAEAERVRTALSGDIGRLATELAEKIVGETLDRERVSATVDRFIDELEAAGGGQEQR
ncbi:F0F1 ATP synthase subunit B [Phytoactinopolyspora halophila]|nr:F0F1 ATP synthase subunit B [Phytoactinopolyspora halophila]